MTFNTSHNIIKFTLFYLFINLLSCHVHASVSSSPSSSLTPPSPSHPPAFFWGEPDANIDWCEANYVFTPYIAEFFNTISSIPITILGVIGYIMGRRHAFMEGRFALSFIMIMLVGIGSTLFHATLRRYAQCLDELPMMWAALLLLYNAIDHAPSGNATWHPAYKINTQQTQRYPIYKAKRIPFLPNHPLFYRTPLKIFLVFLGSVLTTIYFAFPHLFFVFFLGYSSFLISFTLIMTYHIFFSNRAYNKNLALLRAESRESASLLQAPQLSFPKSYSPLLQHLFWLAFFGYFGGFSLWVYENTFCSSLHPLFQFHSIWHIMAGFGTFCVVQCQMAWRSEEYGGRCYIEKKMLLPCVIVKYPQ